MPILLVKNPSAVRLRRNEKNSTPWLRLCVRHGILAIGDAVEHLLLLLRRAIEIGLAIAVRAGGVEPHQPAAQLQVDTGILAGEQVNELRSAGFDRASASASAGKIVSQSACRVLYCVAGKNFGVYA